VSTSKIKESHITGIVTISYHIRCNFLRGRERSEDATVVWYINEFRQVQNLITNQTVHGTVPTLIGDGLDKMVWAGPMVIVMREDSAVMDPRPGCFANKQSV
jgi:hypothetical protein